MVVLEWRKWLEEVMCYDIDTLCCSEAGSEDNGKVGCGDITGFCYLASIALVASSEKNSSS